MSDGYLLARKGGVWSRRRMRRMSRRGKRQCRMRSTGVLRVLRTQYVLEWDVIEKKDSTEHWC
jgi:hypothetical protein